MIALCDNVSATQEAIEAEGFETLTFEIKNS